MKKLQFLISLIFLTTSLFAKTHDGTLKFMDLKNGSPNSFDKLKIYDLKIKVPFETNLIHKFFYIEINMGAMDKQNERSYNTLGSPKFG